MHRNLTILAVALALAMAPVAALAGVDQDGRTTVNISVDKAFAFGEVLCTTTAATKIGTLASRRSLVLQNLAPNAVWICPGDPASAPSAATCAAGGMKILADPTPWPEDSGGAIAYYCVATTANHVAAAGLRWRELR